MARPLKAHDAGTQVTIGLRVPAELKAELEEAAAAADRTLSAECERRLRLSLEPDDADEMLIRAIDAVRERGGINSVEVRDFVRHAVTLTCGQSEPSVMGAWLAWVGGMASALKATGTGKVQLRKADLDRLKAAIRELERDCVIATEEK